MRALTASEAGAAIIELNLADPHAVCNTGGACNINVVRAILSQVRDTQVVAPLAVKPTPFQTRAHLNDTLHLLQQMAVQIGGAVQHKGPDLFGQLKANLATLLQQNGYNTLSDLRRASQA
ncbi:MAG: hypothetical protein O7G88_20350 [bacterium]|nr:hypothetical protein [bacterium]